MTKALENMIACPVHRFRKVSSTQDFSSKYPSRQDSVTSGTVVLRELSSHLENQKRGNGDDQRTQNSVPGFIRWTSETLSQMLHRKAGIEGRRQTLPHDKTCLLTITDVSPSARGICRVLFQYVDSILSVGEMRQTSEEL